MSHWESRIHFDASEFGEHADRMESGFVAQLDLARGLAGVPFVITSAWRSKDDSKSHWLGKAVDIRAKDGVTRNRIVRGLIEAGFVRIGVYSKTGHVHADTNTLEEGFPQDVFWVSVGRA